MFGPSTLLRLLAKFGTIAITGGALGCGLATLLARACHIPDSLVSHFIYSITIASTLGSAYIDSKFEITSSLQKKIWLREIRDSQEQLRHRLIDYRQALERTIHAEYELSVPANLLGRAFTRTIAKKVRDDKLWIVRNVLPYVSSKRWIDGRAKYDLLFWTIVVSDLAESLAQVEQRAAILSGMRRLFRSKSLVRDVLSLWETAYEPSRVQVPSGKIDEEQYLRDTEQQRSSHEELNEKVKKEPSVASDDRDTHRIQGFLETDDDVSESSASKRPLPENLKN